jgi:hypothetical protein
MAGLLGEIFGTADVAKRKLKDVMANPLLSAQQFMGNVNDRARNLNEMTAAAAREGVDYGPASQRLGGLLADAYNPMGMMAVRNFTSTMRDASDIFGQGAKRIQYTDPQSGGLIEVLQRPDGTASVLGLEVPERMRGKGVGQSSSLDDQKKQPQKRSASLLGSRLTTRLCCLRLASPKSLSSAVS